MPAHLGDLELVKSALEREGLVLHAEHVGIAIKEICALRSAAVGADVGSSPDRERIIEVIGSVIALAEKNNLADAVVRGPLDDWRLIRSILRDNRSVKTISNVGMVEGSAILPA